MTTLVAQTALNAINPTEGFVSYVQDVKPYHSKILEVLIEYVYKENIVTTVTEGQNWTISLVRPDTGVTTTCGYGVIWDSLVVSDYPTVTIHQAVGDVHVTTVPLVDSLQPTVLTIANDPLNYTLQVGDPITFQTTGTLPQTSSGPISPGLVYYVLSNNGTEVTVSTSPTGSALTFTTAGSGTISIHPENLPYNTFLVDQPAPVQYQCIASNVQANQFTFVKAYNVVSVNPAAKEWTVAGHLLQPASQDITFSVVKQLTDPTNLVPAFTYKMTVTIDGIGYFISALGSSLSTIGDIITAINTAIGGTGTAALITTGTTSVIRVTTTSVGYSSSVNIVDGPGSRFLMKAVTDFGGYALAVNDTVIIPSNYLYVRNNTGAGANTQFTIVSGLLSGANTIITVSEAISTQAANNGVINIQDDITLVPAWIVGTAVQISGSTLPTPLNASTKYYFVPTDVNSIFNLSYKPFPTEHKDIVDITNAGAGMLNIQRTELFYPGAVVSVSGSFESMNDGTYHINQVVKEGSRLRVYTQQKVSRYSPPSRIPDGMMRLDDHIGYDYPRFCAVVDAPDLYTSAFVDEHLSFEFTLSLTDRVMTVMYEDNAGTPRLVEATTFVSSSPNASGVLPTGYDTQFFDLGMLDEDLNFVNHNLPKTL